MKTLLQEAIADANDLKKVAVEAARLKMQEVINPKLRAILEASLAEQLDAEEDLDMPKEESVLEKLQGLGLDETTLAQLTAALEGKKPKSEDDEPKSDDDEAESTEEAFDIDKALSEIEAEKGDDEQPKDDEDEDLKEDTEGLSEDEINKILSEMDESDDDKKPEDDEAEPAEAPEDDEDPIDENLMEKIAKIVGDTSKMKAVKKAMKDNEDEIKAELEETKRANEELSGVISEVNLLNAKMTNVSKLLMADSLNESQKAKIIAAFDKVKTAGEANILFEALNVKISEKPKNKTSITESLGLTRNTKVATAEPKVELYAFAEEFKKRAGIKN